MNTAVQLWDGQLSVITTPIPHVSTPNEVLVKVAFSGVCGTDLHILAGEFPSAKCVILGHEFAGVVTERDWRRGKGDFCRRSVRTNSQNFILLITNMFRKEEKKYKRVSKISRYICEL